MADWRVHTRSCMTATARSSYDGSLGRNVIARKNLEPRGSGRCDPGNLFPGDLRSRRSLPFEVEQKIVKLLWAAFDLDLQTRARVPYPTCNMQLFCKAVDHGTKANALNESVQNNVQAFGANRICGHRHNSPMVMECSRHARRAPCLQA